MAVTGSNPGCLIYFFVVLITTMGYLPFGHHSVDFSKDGKKVAYAYNLKEVRVFDLEKHSAGEPMYTAADGYYVDTVHWNRTTGDIYAVAHNYPVCDEAEDPDKSHDRKLSRKWNAEILRMNEAGGKPVSVAKRTFYCPEINSPFMGGSGEVAEGKENPVYHAPYQEKIEKRSIAFKPAGWENGFVYYVEPDEMTSRPASVYRMDLKTGGSEKMFALPEDVFSCKMSPSAKYLSCVKAEGEENEQVFSVSVREISSGKVIFDEMIGEPPAKDSEEDEEVSFFELFAGADGITAFDEANDKFFYLKYDGKKKKIVMLAKDLGGGEAVELYSANSLAAPLPVPQKKAVLVTALNMDFSGMMDNPMSSGGGRTAESLSESGTVALVSYDGKDVKKLDAPPVFATLMNMGPADVALSPDGNTAVFPVSFKLDSMSKPGEYDPDADNDLKRTTVLPALMDLDKGTIEPLITKPVDNLAAGMYLFKLERAGEALPYLEKYVSAFKPGDLMYTKAAFALLMCYQETGRDAEAKKQYDYIYEKIVAEAQEPPVEFALNYMAVASDSERESLTISSDPSLGSIPRLNDNKLDFVQGELKRAVDAGSGSGAYWMGVLMARREKYEEALAQFVSAAEKMKETPDGSAINMHFILGELYEKTGAGDRAIEEYGAYFESNEGYLANEEQAHRNRAGLLEAKGRYAEAAEDYEALLQKAKEELNNAIEWKFDEGSVAEARKKVSEIEAKIDELKSKQK